MSELTRVLILEDDEELRDSLALVLEDEGYEVMVAGRAEDAVAQAQQVPFDLIVSDVRLPGMNGLDAVEQVRERQPEIRSMVVTGYSSEADSVRALQLGIDQYLRKPFSRVQFLEAVKRLMAQRRQELQWAARERSLRKTTLWVLETLVRQLPRPDGPGLVGLGRLAWRAAQELGLAEESAEEVRMATLAGLFAELGAGDAAGLLEELPVSSRRQVELSHERWDGSGPEGLSAEEIPLGSRIVAAAVALAQAPPSSKPGTALAEKSAGAFDPRVLALLDQLVSDTASRAGGLDPESHAAGKRRRSLLSLARMLEDGQQVQGALKAYQEVVSSAATSREGVEALLGLSRLARTGGDTASHENHARQAYQVSRQLSPLLGASVALEVGLMLGPRGRSLAEESARAYHHLSLVGGEARARLAYHALAPPDEPLAEGVSEALGVLMQVQFSSELMESAPWLLPFLLRRQAVLPDPVAERALMRLARDAPREPARLLDGSPSTAEKLALIVALRAGRGPGWEEMIKKLESDADPGVRGAVRQALQNSEGTPSGPPVVRLYALGPMEVFVGEERVPDKLWKSRKVRHLLARLAQAQKPIPEEVLIEDFWPEDAVRGGQNLRAAISSLRRALRPTRWEGEDPQYVQRTSRCLALNRQFPIWHDVDEFSRLNHEAAAEEAHNPAAAVALWRRAVQLYRGPYLEDCYSDWSLLVRERVEREQFDSLRKLCHHCSLHNQMAEVLDYGRRLLEVDPCCQEGYLVLMRANVALGRAEVAVRLYERCARTLRQELAMEPSIELVEAHQRAILSLSSPMVG